MNKLLDKLKLSDIMKVGAYEDLVEILDAEKADKSALKRTPVPLKNASHDTVFRNSDLDY